MSASRHAALVLGIVLVVAARAGGRASHAPLSGFQGDQAQGADARPRFASSGGGGPTPAEKESLAVATRRFLEDASIEVAALDALSNRRLAPAVDPGAAGQPLERTPETWRDAGRAWQDRADGVQAALAAFRRTAREDARAAGAAP